jgi:hypothetical protein
MLDVHPPHHAASTWRDFFIHIATICVGLLIAIAFEQAVEALHHTHQRRELIEDLRSEWRARPTTRLPKARGKTACLGKPEGSRSRSRPEAQQASVRLRTGFPRLHGRGMS